MTISLIDKTSDIMKILAFPRQMIHAAQAIEGHDKKLLLECAARLKTTSGEEWAVGELLERVILACDE